MATLEENTAFKFILTHKIVILLYFAIILSLYLPTLINDYAFSDDYVRLYKSLNNIPENGLVQINGGRILYGLMAVLDSNFIGSYESLKVFRLIYAITIILYSLLFYAYLTKYDYFPTSPYLRFLLPLTISCSPPLYLFGAWFSCWPYCFAILSGLGAYILLSTAVRVFSLRTICALLLLVVSFTIYQPAALLFLVYVAISLYHNGINIKKFSLYMGILFISILFALFFVKIFPTYLSMQLEHVTKRSALDINIFQNFIFLKKALYFDIKGLFLYDLSKTFILLYTSFLAYCIYILYKHIFNIFIFITLVIISYSPVLLTTEKWLSLRSSITIICFTILISMVGLTKITRYKILNTLSCCLFSLFIIFHTAYIFYHNFILTSKEDFNQFYSTVIPYIINSPYCVQIDTEKRNYAIGKFHLSDEIGVRSSAIDWSYPGMLAIINSRHGIPNVGYHPEEPCIKILQRDIK